MCSWTEGGLLLLKLAALLAECVKNLVFVNYAKKGRLTS